VRVLTRVRIVMWCAPRRFCWRRRVCPTRRSPSALASRANRCRSGESGSLTRAYRGWRSGLAPVVRDLFPPVQIAEVKALACELPAEKDVPLSRWSSTELAREAVARGIVERISGVTVWRWLSADAIRPWNYRSWIFPRDPQFKQKAGRLLDLSEGRWEGQLLEPGDYVVCADEKPSIQARRRIHESAAAKPRGEGQLVEHEYERKGALCYLAAWDARRARIFDRCAAKDGIEPFDMLVEQFMSVEPYRNAQRVFLVVDNVSAHRGKKSIKRLQGAWPNIIVVHTPVHASWLNQCEIYFSIVQRKALPAEQLRRPRRARTAPLGVRTPLRADRQAVRVEVHPPRPRPGTRPARPGPPGAPDPASSVTHQYVKTLQRQRTSQPATQSSTNAGSKRRVLVKGTTKWATGQRRPQSTARLGPQGRRSLPNEL
jgi:hypothetical protein